MTTVKTITVLIPTNTDPLKGPYSEYWKNIHDRFIYESHLLSDNFVLKIFTPQNKYRENLIGEVKNSDYLVTSFARPDEETLNEIKRNPARIVAIDVPPNEEILQKFGDKIIAYIGSDHRTIGKTLGNNLFSGEKFDCCIVVMHDNYGHLLRLEGIKEITIQHNIPCFPVRLKESSLTLPEETKDKNLGVIALGTKEVRTVQQFISPEKIKSFVGVDMNSDVANLIKSGTMSCSLVQQPQKIAEKTITAILAYRGEPYNQIYTDFTVVGPDKIK